MIRKVFFFAASCLLVLPARADIFEWEWIDPNDHSLGKRKSTTLVPDGAGVNAHPGANLTGLNLTRAHMIGADLVGAQFDIATLIDADFSDANLFGTDFANAFADGADFRNANLNNARFGHFGTVTGSDFTGASVLGTTFQGMTQYGFVAEQLYSTASYKSLDLTGIDFSGNFLSEWNFAGQNLSGSEFAFAILTNADFTGANLSGSDFLRATLTNANLTNAKLPSIRLTDADLTGTDTRSAESINTHSTTITRNMIRLDGSILGGLHINPAETMRLWDYDGDTPIPIFVEDGMTVDQAGTLRAVFDADEWGSTISFEAGIDVMLGGTLLLEFDDEVNLAEQLGRTINLFNWGGVSPSGTFTVNSLYGWDLSNLYTTGEVTLVDIPMLPGDFDADGDVDGVDFLAWQGNPNAFDSSHWRANYGGNLSGLGASTSVPEPRTLLLLILGLLFLHCNQR